MSRQLKTGTCLTIHRPFSVFFQEDLDTGGWTAHVVGYELDNVTCADTPEDAAFMVADMMRMLTGKCLPMDPAPHDWSIDTMMESSVDDGDPRPAWQCSRCSEKASKSEFEVDKDGDED